MAFAEYKGEYFTKGVDVQKRPDIVFSFKIKVKSKRERWTDDEREKALAWIYEQRNRLNDFINDF